MDGRRIIYYECENISCGLRFPELRDGLLRERCPMCRERLRITGVIDDPTNENGQQPRPEYVPIMESLLDNIRSGLNVGSIFRSADGIGISKLYLGGITPVADDAAVKKTALGAETSVSWEKVLNGVVRAEVLAASGYCLWALETKPEAESIYESGNIIPDRPLVLVVGNEVCGVDPKILAYCERTVCIPMVGQKRSYNVATAFGIAASYLRYCQIVSHVSERRFPNTRLIP